MRKNKQLVEEGTPASKLQEKTRHSNCGAACKMQRAPGLQLFWAITHFEVGFPVMKLRLLVYLSIFILFFKLTLLLVRNSSPILLLLVYSLLWSDIGFLSGVK